MSEDNLVNQEGGLWTAPALGPFRVIGKEVETHPIRNSLD